MARELIKVKPYTWISPHYLNVFTGGVREIGHLKKVKRGKISNEFNNQMRKRFLFKIEEYPEFKPYLFITLTYPYDIYDMDKSYYHLKQFVRIFDSEKPLIFWKKEFQIKTKRVHYHLLVGKVTSKINKDYYKKVLDYWNKIIYYKTPIEIENYSKSSTNVKKVKSEKGCINYLTFYLNKKEEQTIKPDNIENVGRWWGHFNTNCHKKVKLEKLEIDYHLAILLEKKFHKKNDSPDYDYTEYEYHSNLFFCDNEDKQFYNDLKDCL